MASISKRRTSNGKVQWQVRWRTGGRDSAAKARTFASLADARVFAAQLDTTGDPTGGASAALASLTFAEYRDRWLDQQEALTRATGRGTAALAPATLIVYRACTAHAVDRIGHIPMAGITMGDIQGALVEMATRLAIGTVKVTRAALSRIFDDAVQHGAIRFSPVPTGRQLKLPKPRTPRHAPKAYTPGQVAALVTAANDYSTKALVQILAYLGLRRGEALGLQWHHLDLGDEPVLHVRQIVIVENNQPIVQPFTKTPESMRSIPLSANEAAVLRELMAHQVARSKLLRGVKWSPSAFVFPRSERELHEPSNPEVVSNRLKRLRDAIGADDSISPVHGLRHAAVSAMVNAGIPAPVVARRVGHANIAQTLNTYAHSTDDDLLDAAQQMDAVWAKAGAEAF